MEGETRDALSKWLDDGGRAALDVATIEASDIIALVDRELKIRYINYTEQGFTREGVTGLSVLDITPPDYCEVSKEVYRHVFDTGEPKTYEVIFKTERRLHVWDVRTGPIRIGGEIVGAITINNEVSEQRRQSVERDRFFLLSLDMLVVVTGDGRLSRANPALAVALGYEMSELLERPFLDLLHPDDRESTRRAFDAVLAGDPVSDFENRCRCKDNSYRALSWRATVDPVTGDVHAVARDVTEQRNTEMQLLHAQKMDAIGQLAGGVAHDFNNLIQAILANTELALADGPDALSVSEHLREIQGAGERAAALTKQLLAFSRRQPHRPVSADLNQLIRGLMAMLRRLLPENISFQFVPGSMPATVNADTNQIEQVIVNLCVNARDAMISGGRLILETDNVVITEQDLEAHPWASPGPYVLLSVADTGVGMTREARERAFEPFFTTKPMHQGTGLGLSTVYGILRQHEGMVQVKSELGQGTQFKVFLPASPHSVLDRWDKIEWVPPRGQETILVAEDEPQVRRVVAQILRRSGYRVLLASNGMEAVQLIRKSDEPVHLAILDVVMPELGGPETWEQIRLLRPEIRVLFASGYTDERDSSRLPSKVNLLAKPFRMDELLVRIRQTLDDG